jgi:hypothetical protein
MSFEAWLPEQGLASLMGPFTTVSESESTKCRYQLTMLGLIGTACYSSAFKLSLLACTAAFILSIIAGVRRERLRKTAKRK